MYEEPEYDIGMRLSTMRVAFKGDWHSEMPEAWKDGIQKHIELEPMDFPCGEVVFSLWQLGMLDAWGEERIIDVVDRALSSGMRVGWFTLGDKRREHQGLQERLVRRRGILIEMSTGFLGARKFSQKL